MLTLTLVTIALILTIIVIVVSEICLSIENHDLTDQLNEQIRINKYLADQITILHRQTKPTTILPPQE
jgi:hypothetical protein